MRNKSENKLHPRQIPTMKHVIKEQVWDLGQQAVYSLIKCLAEGPDIHVEQKNLMIRAAVYFERLSCLVYRGKEGDWKKLPVSKYYYYLFEIWAETPEEVASRIKYYGVDPGKAKQIHKLLWQAADIICPMMACTDKQGFVSEYAYAIEYVIRHNGNLPKPEMEGLFPQKYGDYRWSESSITKELEQYNWHVV